MVVTEDTSIIDLLDKFSQVFDLSVQILNQLNTWLLGLTLPVTSLDEHRLVRLRLRLFFLIMALRGCKLLLSQL